MREGGGLAELGRGERSRVFAHPMRRHFGDVMGEDATLLEKTRPATDVKFRVFLSLKPWQKIQTQKLYSPIHLTTTTGHSPLSHPLPATSPTHHTPLTHLIDLPA